jgi:hypothetical protein
MGTLTFLLPDPLPAAAARCLEQASLATGYDQSPVPTRRRFENGQLALTKDSTESGYLATPWPVAGLGVPLCLSATLVERPEPYHLLLELARGKLNQVRNLTAEWESIGMVVDLADRAELDKATRLFGRAVINAAENGSVGTSMDVLSHSLNLAERITRSFAEQLLHTRLSESGRLTTDMGWRISRIPSTEEQVRIARSCTAVRLVPDWRAIEPTEAGYEWSEFDNLVDWAETAGLRLSIGPVIDLGNSPFPDWLSQWHGDLPSLAAFTCDFVETIIRRYQGRVRIWQVFAGFNHSDSLGLGEDDRIRLAARLLDSARQTDPDGEWVVGVSQPWGDYLASEDYTYSPLVFADTLMRAGFNLSALELELIFGGGIRASRARDPLEVYRILELFSVLGIPLEVTIGTVGSVEAELTQEVCPEGWAETALALAVALPQIRSAYWSAQTFEIPSAGTRADWTPPQGGLPATLEGLRRKYIE